MPKHVKHADGFLSGGPFHGGIVPCGAYTSRLVIVDDGGMEFVYQRTDERRRDGSYVFTPVPPCSK